ncbi:AfsR/SARP family transcriptional regulator [Amycolatopsis aidingensis]|uniref:AfsR/SARP family transcriptional regulator n=1 Tax=Amycolatopsis aidingensis TaxID=2842453 RepID=UPI001C0D11DA|nr:BTAD domain-containing putative transcriptional regulator [Amycolatopsis aidingensis]
MAVTFGVLGEIEAWRDDKPVELGHLRQRCVLAALLADANRAASADQLVDRVWGDRVPDRARHALYSYLSRLRRALRPEVEITRRSGGYLLVVDEGAVDLHQFRELTERSRSATGDGEAVDLLDRALRLWRGEAFSGLDTPWFTLLRNRLHEERLTARLRRNDLALRLSRHAELVPELLDDAAAHPLDEHIAGQLILALYRGGRQAEALEHYQRVRERLVTELGTDPGPELRALHQQVLAADPDLASPAAAEEAAAVAVPRQLPAPPPLFVGRADEQGRLDAALSTGDGTVPVATINGPGGIGKTWLALRSAHRHLGRFPDGQLYANLRGFDPKNEPLEAADVVRGFLDAFGVPPERVPDGFDAQAAMYRSLLADRRVLVVLDNARNTEQVQPLLPGSPGCPVLVTSRDRLAGLVTTHNALPIALDTLTGPEGTALLAGRLGRERVAAEPEAVSDLIDRCARLPLALGIVAARATTNPGLSLRALADELRGERDRLTALEALTTDETATDIRAVTSWSYHALAPQAARLFRLLGLHPGWDVSLHAAASLDGSDLSTTRRLLEELTRTHLLEQHAPGHYRAHDLLRAYAAERAAEEETEPSRQAATHRLLDHYLHTGFAAERHLAPHWEAIALAPPLPGVTAREVADYPEAMAWFSTEQPNLLAAVDHAVREGFDTHAWQLPWTLSTFLNRQGYWRHRAATQQTALAAADRLGDRTAKATTHHLLGRGYAILGEDHKARTHLDRALTLFGELGDRTGQATTRFSFSQLSAQQQRPTEALEHSRHALELYRDTGNKVWEAFALSAVGRCEAMLGQDRRALAHCHEALELLRVLGNRDGQAHTLHGIGYAHQNLGEHAQAASFYQRAAPLFRELGDHYHEATALRCLGDARHAGGEPQRAREAWQRALDILDGVGHPDADAVRARLAS